jgi:hypothetical protein
MKILDIVTNFAGGGLLGIVGQFAVGWLEVWRADKESARKIAEMKALAEIKTEEVKQAAFAAAQAAEQSTNTGHGWLWVEAVKTLWRPFLTLLLLGFLVYVYSTANEYVRGEITGELTACALGAIWFWFGTRYAAALRSPSSPPKR